MRRTAAALLLLVGLVTTACSGDDSPSSGRDAATSTTEARPPGYVALGDSFSAGVGAPPYDAASGKCEQSSLTWPKLLDGDEDTIELLELRACGGAQIEHLLGPWDSRALPAQIPTAAEADPDPTVGLVTLTIGGNDAGFSELVARCVLGDCSDVPGRSEFVATLRTVTDQLADQVYPAIRAAFPDARIVHVGYPRLTPAPGQSTGDTCGWITSDAEQDAIAGIVGALDGAIEAAVDRTTIDDVAYVDAFDTFAGHELCTDDPWVNDVVSFDSGRAHPTAAGYEALADAVGDAIESPADRLTG
jgi:lysophospholipase L1-like esterase